MGDSAGIMETFESYMLFPLRFIYWRARGECLMKKSCMRYEYKFMNKFPNTDGNESNLAIYLVMAGWPN